MLNEFNGMGRLTADPVLRYTQTSVPVCTFTIAVDRDFKDGNGERGTDFITCVAWRWQAQFLAQYFRKGSLVVVTGSIQNRRFTDSNGVDRTVNEVIARNVYPAGAKRDAAENVPYDASETGGTVSSYSDISDADGELPFEFGG